MLTWFHFGSQVDQNPSKSRSPNASKKWSIFASRLSRVWVRFWPPRRAQDGPKRPPRRPRRPQEAAKTGQETAKTAPKRVQKNRFPTSFFGIGRQEPPRAPRDPSKRDFWSILINFGSIVDWFFGQILIDVGLIVPRLKIDSLSSNSLSLSLPNNV